MAVTVLLDYVIYKNMQCGESRLTFCTDCIKIECSDASGNGKLVLEYAVADIISIHWQWSESVGVAVAFDLEIKLGTVPYVVAFGCL